MKEKFKSLYKKHGKKAIVIYLSFFAFKWMAVIFFGGKILEVLKR